MPVQISFELPHAVAVSGAASGLGSEICQLLVENGVYTVGVDLTDAASQLKDANGYHHVTGDVTDELTWLAVVDRLKDSGSQSYGLITSAAILDVGLVTENIRSEILRTFDVNVVGTALAMKALIPLMVETGGGSIVAVASVNASFAEQQLAFYNASKAAVRQLARTAALDHAREGIRVNVLSPGAMMAGLFQRHLESAADPDLFHKTRAKRQPVGRITSARDVAMAGLFLLSSGAGALLGSEITADGGLTTSFDFRTGEEGASI
jgi:NAD(P)-dependent dehydrogenase (short-subunit alcohol dehydrogenase family)